MQPGDMLVMTLQDVYDMIRRECRAAGGQAKWGQQQADPISASYITDVLHGRRDPGEKILKALGLVAETRYVKRRKTEEVDPAAAAASVAQRRALAQALARAVRAAREARKAQG